MKDEPVPNARSAQATRERRRRPRVPAPYHAIICNSQDMVAAAGRTENISSGGCLMIIAKSQEFHLSGNDFVVSISVPNDRGGTRLKTHNCVITRVQRMESGEVAVGVCFTS